MTYSNQFTIEEANEKSLNDLALNSDDDLYASADSWGEEYIGTMETWEDEIPTTEKEAKSTGWYDWFSSDDDYDSWGDYRDYLVSQLISVEIVEE